MNRETSVKAPRIGIFGLICAAGGLLLLGNCRSKEEKKSYSEVKGFDSPVQAQAIKINPNADAQMPPPSAPSNAPKLQWELPEGWHDFPGSGMRMAVIKTSDAEGADECGIVSLPGAAGGLEANVTRWLGQLNITLPPESVEKFISSQQRIKTRGNFELVLIDFGSLVKDDAGTSMLVGVATPGNYSYFIKLTGKKSNLSKAGKDFARFCQSLNVLSAGT